MIIKPERERIDYPLLALKSPDFLLQIIEIWEHNCGDDYFFA